MKAKEEYWRVSKLDLASLEKVAAEDRVRWALENLPGSFFLSSSFGVQSAVMLHLVTRIRPELPVLLVDTGYLFQETYQFVDKLVTQLDLNLHVVLPNWTAARFETKYGQLWKQGGVEGIDQYNQMMKVEPFERALAELDVGTWFAGLRREQSCSRKDRPVLEQRPDGRFKVYPLIDWSSRDIHRYLVKHDLPYHPLWEKGYVSVGDWHTSHPLTSDMSVEETRFFGLKRECGLHG